MKTLIRFESGWLTGGTVKGNTIYQGAINAQITINEIIQNPDGDGYYVNGAVEFEVPNIGHVTVSRATKERLMKEYGLTEKDFVEDD